MPSINQLFGNNDGGQGSDVDFDIDKFLSEADSIIAKASERSGVPQPPVDPEPEPPAIAAAVPEPEPEPVAAILPPEPTLPVEPVRSIDPIEELLRSLPPDRRDAMLRAAAGIDPTPPPTVVEPSLPEHIDPESFEATLWRENQELKRAVTEIAGSVRHQSEMTEQQRASQAAVTAGNAFQARYGFTPDETLEIAKFAGQSGIAGRFAATKPDDLVSAYDEALEHVLWTNPTFRQKVVGAGPAPAPATPQAPTAEAVSAERKRVLTSLSGAANPVSAAAARVEALESRPDGRLTEKSRQQIVKELATGIARGVTQS